MYQFDSSKSVDMYGGKHAFGFEITNIDKALDEIDFSQLKLSRNLLSEYARGCYFPYIREGVLAYVQKGRNKPMKNPFIVTEVNYNPNENTVYSIEITFEPTNPQSYEVTLYGQLSSEPKQSESPVDFRSVSEYVHAKDESFNRLADNGSFWAVPDTRIVKTLDNLHISEGLQLVI